jgi:hypothetical protein
MVRVVIYNSGALFRTRIKAAYVRSLAQAAHSVSSRILMKACLRFACSLCVTALAIGGAAAYAESYDFTATGTGASASGTLTVVADPTPAGVFDVTGITGSVNGEAITGLLPCATYDVSDPCSSSGPDSFAYDNLL